MNPSLPTLILIGLGTVLMGFAIDIAARTLRLLRATRYLRNWYVLLALMSFFAVGYLFVLVMALIGRDDIIAILTGIIFAFGGFFVFFAMRLEQLTISELADTRLSMKYIEDIFASIPEPVLTIAPSGTIQSANPALLRLTGFTDSDVVGGDFSTFFKLPGFQPGKDLAPVDKAEGALVKKDKSQVAVTVTISAVAGGSQTRLVCIASDISDRKHVEEALKLSEERYALATYGANYGVWDWDIVNNQVYYSPQWKTLLGYEESEIGASIDDWLKKVHPDDIQNLDLQLKRHLQGASPHFEVEHRLMTRGGKYRWFLANGTAAHEESGKSVRMVGSLHDITEARLAKEKLEYEALHDPLTSLPNRAFSVQRMDALLEKARSQPDSDFAIFLVDLDGFKTVSERYGQNVSDQLLIGLARRLEKTIRPNDVLARVSGDEFMIVAPGIASPRDARGAASRVMQTFQEPYEVARNTIKTTCSMGVLICGGYYKDALEILRDANIAVFQAKNAGGNQYAILAQVHPGEVGS